MRNFFDINIPFNRLQFNICFFVLGALFIFLSVCFFNNFSIFEEYPVDYPIFVQWLILIGFLIDFCLFFVALYKRLKDLNWTNKYIINAFFGCFLVECSFFVKVFLMGMFSLPYIIGRGFYLICIAISVAFLLYVLFHAIFVKGNHVYNDSYYKPKFKNIFNFKFFKNWLDFKGKATRSEFFLCGIVILLWIVRYLFLFFNCDGVILLIVVLFPILTLSCGIRRLRDIGLSPWHYLILYVVPVNVLLLIVLMFGESEKPMINQKASQ